MVVVYLQLFFLPQIDELYVICSVEGGGGEIVWFRSEEGGGGGMDWAGW